MVTWAATEDEYSKARREGRSAVEVPWPTEQMHLSSPRLPWQHREPANAAAGLAASLVASNIWGVRLWATRPCNYRRR